MQVNDAIKSLYKRLNISPHATVILHDFSVFSDIERIEIYKMAKEQTKKGVLGILSDSDLNQNVSFKPKLASVSTNERLILGAGKLQQLLSLEDNVRFNTHPSVMLAYIGDRAEYIQPQDEIDFPLGPHSIFNKLYENDTFIFLDENTVSPIETKFAFSFLKYVPIKKNTTYSYTQEIISYLDYDVEPLNILKHPKLAPYVYYEEVSGRRLYAYNYKELVDTILKLFIHKK